MKKKSARTRLSKPSALFIPISQVEATTTAASPSSSTYVLIFMIDHRPARHFLAYCSFFSRLFRFFSPFLAFSRCFLDSPAHFLVFYRLFSPFRAFFLGVSFFFATSRCFSPSLAFPRSPSLFLTFPRVFLRIFLPCAHVFPCCMIKSDSMIEKNGAGSR